MNIRRSSSFHRKSMSKSGTAGNNLIDHEVYETNERKVNEIYLSTIAIENYSFTSAQLQELESIMEQCPFIRGPAVYTARGIYSLIDPGIVWNDDNICILSGVAPRLAKPYDSKNIFSIFPNPASDQLTVQYFINEDANAKLYFYSELGTLIRIEVLDKNSNKKTIDVSKLDAGIYTCSIVYNNQIKFRRLISIVK